MTSGKRKTIRITVPFGVLVALLCQEAFRLVSREQEAYRLVHRALPGFLSRYGNVKLVA